MAGPGLVVGGGAGELAQSGGEHGVDAGLVVVAVHPPLVGFGGDVAGPVGGLGIARPDDAAWEDAARDAEGDVALLGLEVVAGDDGGGIDGAGVGEPEAAGDQSERAKACGGPAITMDKAAQSGDRAKACRRAAEPEDKGAGDGKGGALAGIGGAAGLGDDAQQKPDEGGKADDGSDEARCSGWPGCPECSRLLFMLSSAPFLCPHDPTRNACIDVSDKGAGWK